ncbi:LuxR C-terminal-related transcriptional regulator [Geodermatophilus sp. URMC 64]
MTLLDGWSLDAAPTEGGTDLPATAERLLGDLGGPNAGGTVVAVRGAGGTGKSALLAELGALYAAAGLPVLDLRRAPAELPGDASRRGIAVLVDDAHRLAGPQLAKVRRLAGDPGVRIALAYRPWPCPPELSEVVCAGDSGAAVLGYLTRPALQRWATRELGTAVAPSLVDAVLQQTAGLPALALPLLRWLARTAPSAGPARGAPAHPARMEVPPEVTGRIRGDLAAMDDGGRGVLCALAVGAPLDTDLLGDALEVPSRQAAELVSCARASGYLLPSGQVIPLVRRVLLAGAPRETVRGLRRRLLGLLLDRGDQPVELARALAAEGDRDARAGQLLEELGSAALTSDPGLAGELLADAAAVGRPAGALAARRAQAAALLGDFDPALQWADTALQDDAVPDRPRAAGVAAAVLAQRGLLARSADLLRLAGPDAAGARALVLLAGGARDEAEAALRDDGSSAAGLLAAGQTLTAQGVLASLGTAGSDDVAVTLSLLARATALLEPIGRGVLLTDTPAALAALVALHNGEPAIAESVLRRALTTDLGGRPARSRHLLLLAWAAMLRGRLHAARGHMTEAAGDRDGRLEPRDELFLRALEVGLARRTSDLPALTQAWERAREALLRQPVDLFALLPLGELVVAGSRLGAAEVLAPHRAAAAELLARLGGAPLWATALHWSGVQAAILTGDPAALGPHATALVSAARTNRFAAALVPAGRSWLRVLTDDVDAAAVVAAAEGLGGVGLAWDGSRLAGQAAARAADPRDRTALLQCARALAEDDGTEPAARPGAAPPEAGPEAGRGCQLSSREREVAELLVAGQTYREVGGRLFISAKTVEHHVARIRQRLGASNRSDLLARLRAELALD